MVIMVLGAVGLTIWYVSSNLFTPKPAPSQDQLSVDALRNYSASLTQCYELRGLNTSIPSEVIQTALLEPNTPYTYIIGADADSIITVSINGTCQNVQLFFVSVCGGMFAPPVKLYPVLSAYSYREYRVHVCQGIHAITLMNADSKMCSTTIHIYRSKYTAIR